MPTLSRTSATANAASVNSSDLASRPPDREWHVAKQGLIAALEWQISEFASTTELACDSTIDLAPDCAAPEGTLAATAFHLFQEILNNVARHARATLVRIRIRLMPGLLQMDVTDNGVGAAPASLEGSPEHGIAGMRRRTGQCGGSLHIVSVPGGGTHVCLRLPLPPHGASA
ncbi:histidine kinase/DNA gyrase B/HSP90-like ATPase [Paucimonas lemoignei]|uniref:Histidine kinase/DNA gyrase B/HSP90-like ATPase n=1 Tax=Paucimonas lemoignei TaxID=29443 RepID=A0A4R3HVZ9_PAULE|nr:ATP-binding protein [Paucimonas lemoignei]TCS36954.1 histidine kinase/DNA gyrase B/HSP90-like ATPase [Paucimonas lemoignei]